MTEIDSLDSRDSRLIPEDAVWEFQMPETEMSHYVMQHANGSFIACLETGQRPGFGLPEWKIRRKLEEDDVTVIEQSRSETPWRDGWAISESEDRLIPDGTVWEFHFEISHAPHYTIQHLNGLFFGIYARVENVERENSLPFSQTREDVVEDMEKDFVEVVELPREKTPWDDGVYL